ncbi:unnamed protein product [Symbiodinium sp. CCMP2592]|nr:unnamed protein product [Symbiodinium sp. CCMP2592]
MIFWHSGANRNKIRSFVAKELGAIRNIAQLFVQGLKADVEVGVQASLSPFDVNHTLCSDEALPEPDIFKPLAEAAQVEVTRLAKEFLLARPTALLVKSQPPGDKTGGEDLNEIWSRTMRHWSDKLPALSEAAALVLSCFPSTGEIEQNFSWLQQFSEGSLMKVRLDGPTADQLVCREPHSILPRKPCLKLLQEYRRLFAPSGGSQGCRSSLGRRVLNGRLNPLSRAGLKRQRGLEQQQLLQQAPAESQPEDLATLEAEAGESAKRRRTDKQVSLTAALEKYKTKKEEWATLDASSEAAAAGRLIEKEREAEKRFEKMKKIGVARLSAVRSDVLAADRDRLIMVVHGHGSSKTPGLPDLERLGNARAWPESIEVERDFIFKPSESAFSADAREWVWDSSFTNVTASKLVMKHVREKSDWLQTEHSSWRKIRQSVRNRTAGEGPRPVPDPTDPWSDNDNNDVSENDDTGTLGTVPADTGSTRAWTAEAAPWNGTTVQGGAASSTTWASEQQPSSDNQQWASERQQWSSDNQQWHGSGWRWRSWSEWQEADGDSDEDSRAWA